MIDQVKEISQQPWLLGLVIPMLGVIGYMATLIIKQFSRLFTEKSKIK